jgi:hypothetical protein
MLLQSERKSPGSKASGHRLQAAVALLKRKLSVSRRKEEVKQ